MPKFCNKECEIMGSVCDFCIHYLDDAHGKENGFAGEGLCMAKKRHVDATDSCEDDFECVMLESE